MTKSIFQFRSMFLALSAAVFVFVFAACGKDENVKRFQDAAMNLDKTTHTLTDVYDYWPDCGIRVMGSHLASLISLDELQKMLPCPLYVSGPHHDGQWDLNNEEEFGHYNPQAVQYLADLAGKAVADKGFVSASKPLIDKYLYRQMHIMMVLHDAFYDNNKLGDEGRKAIVDEMLETRGNMYDGGSAYFLATLNLDDDTYVYSNIGNQFLYFWMRRLEDGTIDPFYKGLSTIFKAYYPEYEYSTEKYFVDVEEWEDAYWEEEESEYGVTAYNCELESDAPVKDSERIKEKDAVEKIKSAIANLDNTFNVLENEFDYWPACGLRVTGSHLFSLISLKTLNKMLPCDLYVSGPHHNNRWELNSEYEYGHYNPEAVRYLGNLAKKVVADKNFVNTTKPLVDKYLKRQMYILIELYKGLNDKDICDDKQAVLEEIASAKGHSYSTEKASQLLSDLEYIEDDSYVYGNTGEMFLYFWARRSNDGTMDLIYDGLSAIYSAYYNN